MPPALSENEFYAALDENGFRIVRPGDDAFTVWGYVDIGGGVLVNRWAGGATLASQLAYLVQQKACGSEKAVAPKKKGRKKK